MSFVWPELLVSLVIVPGLLAFYVLTERRQCIAAARYAPLYVAAPSPGARHPIVGRLPFILFLLSITLLCFALARPQAAITAVSRASTVILALDVSGSMGADDAAPNRLAQLQSLAKELVDQRSRDTRIGIVAFSANASPAFDPTISADEIRAALDRLIVERGTAIGTGIAAALTMLMPDAGIDPAGLKFGRRAALPAREGNASTGTGLPGSYASGAIVLFTDGQSTSGPDPMEAARLAAELGVRIHAIGVGSPSGKIMKLDGFSMRVRLDEPVLKRIAEFTHGQYYRAGNEIGWRKLLGSLEPRVISERKHTEVAALFSAMAAVAAVAGATISMLWHRRIL